MRSRYDSSGQLFHTYTTMSSKDLSGEQHLKQLLSGYLTLFPHAAQKIGPEFGWDADPLDDANWRYQFHCLVWLDNLRAESITSGSEEGFLLYEKLLKSWVAMNPEDDPASDYSWFDMAVGLRAIVLLFAVESLGPQDWILESIRVHGEHLANPVNYEGRGNHSLHQDMGLIALGQFDNRQDWIDLAVGRILEMMGDAIDDEGVCREGSIDYHYRNYRWYKEAFTRIEAAGVDLPNDKDRILKLMPLFMAHATSPSGDYALIGDTLHHRAPKIPGTPTEWTTDVSKAPDAKVAKFNSGYIFARTSWRRSSVGEGPNYLTMRFGPGRSSAVHGHEDAGSITLDAFGERLLCDSGLFAYEAGDERLFFRGRSSHNVIDAVGRKYYPSADSPLVSYQEDEGFVLATVLVKGLQGVSWHRTMLMPLDANFLLVDDRIANSLPGGLMQRWQLPARSRVNFGGGADKSVRVSTEVGNEIQFTNLGHDVETELTNGCTNPISGWRSDEYRIQYPSPSLAFRQFGESVRFSTLIEWGASAEYKGFDLFKVGRSSKYLDLGLRNKSMRYDIRLASDGVDFRSSPID